MESTTLHTLLEQARQSWITQNPDAFADCFADDGEFIVPGQRYQGRAAIRQVAAEFAQSHTDVTITVHRILVDGNQAVIEWTWADTERETGKRTKAEDAIVVDFAAEQITRWREYIDSQTPSNTAAS